MKLRKHIGTENPIVALEYARYEDENLAVKIRFKDGNKEEISVNVPEKSDHLHHDEFYLNLTKYKDLIKVLIEEKYLILTGKSTQDGQYSVPAARIIAEDMDPIPNSAFGDDGGEYHDGDDPDPFADL